MISAQGRLWAPAPRRAVLRCPPDLGLIVLAVLVLALSGGMLWVVGINYDGITGSAIHKVHPSTYLAVALVAWAILRDGDPVGHLVMVAERRPASLFICAAGLVLLVSLAVRSAPGLAGSVDTFLLPGLVGILLADRDERSFARLEVVVHAVMLANAVLGIVEFGMNQRFFPYRLDGAIFETDTRSAAFQGHPLANATLTACYLAALFAGGGRLTPMARLGMIALQLVALVVFGGRSAIVISLAVGACSGLVHLQRVLVRNSVPLLVAAAGAFAIPLLAFAVGALAYGGFFDKLLARFEADGGSAHARVAMFDLFHRLSLRDLVVGPDPSLIESLRRIAGLEWGIENPLIKSLLYNGALITIILTAAVVFYLVEVGRRCRRGVAAPMIVFVLLINTFESLGGKTVVLAKIAIMVLAIYRPLPRSGERRAG